MRVVNCGVGVVSLFFVFFLSRNFQVTDLNPQGAASLRRVSRRRRVTSSYSSIAFVRAHDVVLDFREAALGGTRPI